MSELLPRLRMDLDIMPSPMEDRPGLLLRDPFHYSDATLIVPPLLVRVLDLFDGEHNGVELRERLYQLTGDLQVGDIAQHLQQTLDTAGFLENERGAEMKERKHREFAESPTRLAAHSGSAYPDEPQELVQYLRENLDGASGTESDSVMGVAAPHVSPEGGWNCYRDAYASLPDSARDKTFVILGTSHYGEPERFGLTRKPFATPLGEAENDTRLVDWLAERAPGAVLMEDYCHAMEHSIEFQVLCLQHRFGPRVRVLPVLCGPFAKSIYLGGMPEETEHVRVFLDSFAELHDRERKNLCWVLGIDMAHIGRRYGDDLDAIAGDGYLTEVEERDRRRLESVVAGDADGFWSQVQQKRDDLKWCGSSPLYTFLRTVPAARGELRRYEQWNIDEASVVSFGGLAFREAN